MRLNILFIFLIFPVLIFSQSPEKFSYQSVIKNSRGYLLKNQEVGLRISILFNSANGASVYSEEHTALSNDNGLITLTILVLATLTPTNKIEPTGGVQSPIHKFKTKIIPK